MLERALRSDRETAISLVSIRLSRGDYRAHMGAA